MERDLKVLIPRKPYSKMFFQPLSMISARSTKDFDTWLLMDSTLSTLFIQAHFTKLGW